jgi:hypothetical protein
MNFLFLLSCIMYSRRSADRHPETRQRSYCRSGTDWLPPSSNAIGPESSRSATFKMPSTLLHLAWIEQLAVRWLTPPVVDVLERGAYTSPLTRAGTKDTGWIHRDHSSVEGLTTLTLLAGAMSPFPYCSDGRDLCFLRPLLSLSQSCALSNLLASSLRHFQGLDRSVGPA